MLLRRWTAPRRPLCHPEKEQCHRRGRSYPTAQSTACSELLTGPERDRPEKNASCCDPDKGPTQRQGQRLRARQRKKSHRSEIRASSCGAFVIGGDRRRRRV